MADMILIGGVMLAIGLAAGFFITDCKSHIYAADSVREALKRVKVDIMTLERFLPDGYEMSNYMRGYNMAVKDAVRTVTAYGKRHGL